MSALRLVFMGTPELAATSLAALLRAPDFQVAAVVTQPDRPKGRDLKLQPSPVKRLALQAGLPVLQPEKAREENFIAELARLKPDLIAVAAFGQILPPGILELPRLGCLNVHTSLLPKYRGASPIQAALLNGDTETGVTIMKMDAGLDTGAILAQRALAIRDDDNAATLHDRLAVLGAELLVESIRDHAVGRIVPQPQDDALATHVGKIRKEDGRLDWTQPARRLWQRVRAFTPWPGAFTHLGQADKRVLLKLWHTEVLGQSGAAGTILRADAHGIIVGCGTEALKILSLQREGGRRLAAGGFLAGHPLPPGTLLGSTDSQK
jgi:methionyl-tRNA formyltransferase